MNRTTTTSHEAVCKYCECVYDEQDVIIEPVNHEEICKKCCDDGLATQTIANNLYPSEQEEAIEILKERYQYAFKRELETQ